MGKEIKNIENLFKSSFEGHKVEPSEKVWNNINTKLKFNKYISSKVVSSIAIIATVAILSVFVSNVFNSEKNSLTNVSPSGSQYTIEQSNQESQSTNNQSAKYPISETSKIIQLKKNSESVVLRKSENVRATDLAPVIVSKSIKVLSYSNVDTLSKLNIKPTPPPSLKFTVKCKEGCVPFELELENLTKSAIAFEWSFGDGQTSTKITPSYTYRYPGVYTVVLKAVGFGGVAVSYIDSVIVHDLPVALVQWPYESTIQTGQKIMIPNKSENISEVEWNFGDNNFSNEINGKHIFNKEGEYSIVLKVKTKNDCIDSAVINNIKVINAKGKIVFPNAFTPNLDGASSGYYSITDKHNDIFYPKTNIKVSNFKIRIFSKAGIEVFKSTDILYGWNGYYQNRLLPEGVYIYIAAGEFEGGQKFHNKGDITILHRK